MKERVDKINELLMDREANLHIEYQTIWKNNCEEEAYIIRGKIGYASPILYRGDWCEKTNEEVAGFIAMAYDEYAMVVNLEGVTDPEGIKKKILPRVSSKDNLAAMQRADIFCMENVVEGLVISFYIPVVLNEGETGTIQITNALLTISGISPDDAYDAAIENLSSTVDLMTMDEALAELTGTDVSEAPAGSPQLLVLTNAERHLGAAAILSKGLYDKIYELLKDKIESERNILMLPSSIHEVLFTTIDENADLSKYSDMVREVNNSQVDPESRLSYSVYGYRDGMLKALA